MPVRPLVLIIPEEILLHDPPRWEREMVIVATAGCCHALASSIGIVGSWSRGDTLVLAVRFSELGGITVDPHDASPAVVMRVPKVRGPVFFIEQ